ncbi:hypothetical protein [Klenkia sp. PcliD-1-E]|uniref:hypothetical protein n=1 Tax=Klenkia sp. PcliD-1-E TaxID=2954492 RepID=UPI0020970243|nr:hypothetical protein [Klenkia sp. PcliD-1-E]MCO7219576.1 hypothetical protein [Klenkia sp. PcliD-1-E]
MAYVRDKKGLRLDTIEVPSGPDSARIAQRLDCPLRNVFPEPRTGSAADRWCPPIPRRGLSRRYGATVEDQSPELTALAAKIVATVAAQGVSLVDPVAGLVAAGFVPALELAVGRYQRQRADNVDGALTEATRVSGKTADQLLNVLSSDPVRLSMLAEALTAAAYSAYPERTRALGRALASGALAEDEATVDAERHWVRLLSRIEAPHLRVLVYLNGLPEKGEETDPKREGRHVAAASGIRDSAIFNAILSDLRSMNLADYTYCSLQDGTQLWQCTWMGADVLAKFNEVGSVTEGDPGPAPPPSP